MNVTQITQEPRIRVGILSAPEVMFSLKGDFQVPGSQLVLEEGSYTVYQSGGYLRLTYRHRHDLADIFFPEDFRLEPLSSDNLFTLSQVRIGIHFHWERFEEQCFEGALHFVKDGRLVVAVNEIPLERYLYSVIASEMKATAGLELLKAHAVISRSWLLAQLAPTDATLNGKTNHSKPTDGKPTDGNQTESPSCGYDSDTHHIRWYERQAHTLFDVCADDHCQRYQGISRSGTPQVKEALEATRGWVLSHGGEICDARFYKCCGGLTESFENAWADTPKPYLRPVGDLCGKPAEAPTPENPAKAASLPDLSREADARAFILSTPEAFCHTNDRDILSQVLNGYDQETQDFYRWHLSYGADELSRIVRERSGIDFGHIQALESVERSPSGRLVQLRIVGDKRSLIVGKELEIRKFLSTSHLYSSAFVVDTERDAEGRATAFHLHGAGWGHGVGLCQIGAAVMSHRGYSHREILSHYYPETSLTQLYD